MKDYPKYEEKRGLFCETSVDIFCKNKRYFKK